MDASPGFVEFKQQLATLFRLYNNGRRLEALQQCAPMLDVSNADQRAARPQCRGISPQYKPIFVAGKSHLDVLVSPAFGQTSLASVSSLGWNQVFDYETNQRTLVGELVRRGKRYGANDSLPDPDCVQALSFLSLIVTAYMQINVGVNMVLSTPSSTSSLNKLPSQVAANLSTARFIRLGHDEALVRVKALPQMKLEHDLEAKLRLIKGSMAADASFVHGRTILLIDDLLESGASIRECARALRQAGASEVHALCFVTTRRYGKRLMG